ncbi:MAG TPA: UbiA family prenyltransferase [Candidatus Methylacidiphilales bacterium]|jgi:4-hydroxybenzoate polyprenyltransferase|nr:UbiA family prenyltransferase [Candidatus Methylacidiphilales bacterium]
MTIDKRGVKTIYVDLDHTLICIDLLRDRLASILLHRPLALFPVLYWLFCGGPARLKAELAARYPVDPANLPYNADLLVFLRASHAAGQRLVLATAAPRPWAEAVAAHLNLFDHVLATTPETGNMKGRRKLEFIQRESNGESFGYAGDAHVDRPILEAAKLPIVVGATAELAGKNKDHALLFPRQVPAAQPWWQALRIHQWSKNILLVAPAVSAHRFFEVWPQVLVAFASFSSVASALYILNDLLDIDVDRKHSQKHRRAIPAGRLDPAAAFALMTVLLLVAAGFSLMLHLKYALVLGCYAATNLIYSKQFKRIAVLDVTVLAFLYSVRVFAGGAACGIAVSTWLAALTFFVALSLAHLKRFVETMSLQPGVTAPARPAYLGEDSLWLAIGGVSSGMISVLVLALYITSAQIYSLYQKPQLLYIICVLQFYWIERMWMKAYRGKMSSDPIAFMLTDRNSYGLAAVVLAIVYISAA